MSRITKVINISNNYATRSQNESSNNYDDLDRFSESYKETIESKINNVQESQQEYELLKIRIKGLI